MNYKEARREINALWCWERCSPKEKEALNIADVALEKIDLIDRLVNDTVIGEEDFYTLLVHIKRIVNS